MQKRHKILLVSLLALLFASALGKWLVFEFVLEADDSGRQRIETGGE